MVFLEIFSLLFIYLFIYFCVDIFFSFFLKSSLFIFYLIEKKSSDSNKKKKKNLLHAFCVNILLTQKMLYEFLASTKYWRKKCYISFWRQQNVDAKWCYKRFGVNKRLMLKDISYRKKVLFFTSTHCWRDVFKRHDLLHHYASTKKLTQKMFFATIFYL